MTTDPGWWAALLGGGGVGAIIKSFLQHRPSDIPVCPTRIVRDGRGLPWNRQIAIHPLEDGRIEMKAVSADEVQDSDTR